MQQVVIEGNVCVWLHFQMRRGDPRKTDRSTLPTQASKHKTNGRRSSDIVRSSWRPQITQRAARPLRCRCADRLPRGRDGDMYVNAAVHMLMYLSRCAHKFVEGLGEEMLLHVDRSLAVDVSVRIVRVPRRTGSTSVRRRGFHR